MILRTLLLLSALVFAHAASLDECDPHLQGDRYYGAFRTLLKVGKLKLEDLDKALASGEPFFPFANALPKSDKGAAKTAFAILCKDEGVRAAWPSTQRHLRELRAEFGASNAIERSANLATRNTLAPKALGHLSTTAHALSWTILNDGTTAIATVEKDRALKVVRPDGSAIAARELPTNFSQPYQHWHVEWSRDAKGELWLYAVGETPPPTSGKPRAYRCKWPDGKFELIELPTTTRSERTMGLIDVGPGHVLLQTNADKEAVNLATSPATHMQDILIWRGGQQATVAPDGRLVTNAGQDPYRSREALLTTTTGDVLILTVNPTFSKILVLGTEKLVRLDARPISPAQILLYESSQHEIYAAMVQQTAREPIFLISVYKPFAPVNPQKPVFSKEFVGSGLSEVQMSLHMFEDAHGGVYIGRAHGFELTVSDVAAKRDVFDFEMPRQIGGWFSDAHQTYFWTDVFSNSPVVFQMFSTERGMK